MMLISAKENLFWVQWHHYWELLQVLVARNLKVRYRGSMLGIYWSLLNPVLMTGVYSAIFGTAFASHYGNSISNYILAVFTGLVVINFFSACTHQALLSVVNNGTLLNKISLPISIFPISIVAANIFQFSAGVLPLLLLITLFHSGNLINGLVLFLPLLALALVCTGIGLLVSGLFVFFRDLPYFYELVVFILWLSSPIFYPASIVPESVRSLLIFNPLLPIIESIRQVTLSGMQPDFQLIGHALLSGMIFCTLGIVSFRGWRHLFMDLL